MIDEDKDRFARLLGQIEAAFRIRFSRETVEEYWRGLQTLTWLEVRHTVEHAIETCRRVPTIAELRALTSTGRVDPTHQHRGTYPPDIAHRRRQLGLPVTPEEHASYAAGEWYTEPLATREQVEAISRDVAPRCAPVFARVLREIADGIHAARAAQEREPGEDG